MTKLFYLGGFSIWMVFMAYMIYSSLQPHLTPVITYYQADKAMHFGSYFIASLIPSLIFYKQKRLLLIIILVICILGVATEVLQINIAGRSFSYFDMLANYLGIGVGTAAGIFIINQIRAYKNGLKTNNRS